jgi:hypothetical protein
MVTDHASVAANWRLFCPTSWDDTTIDDPAPAQRVRERRERAAIPQDVRHREKWRLALEMLDQMLGPWGLPTRPVAGDSGYGDATEFRLGLTERGLSYVLQVDPTATAHPAGLAPLTRAYSGRGRPPVPAYPQPPATLRELALAAGRDACRKLTWRTGTRKTKTNPSAAMRSHFAAGLAPALLAAPWIVTWSVTRSGRPICSASATTRHQSGIGDQVRIIERDIHRASGMR